MRVFLACIGIVLFSFGVLSVLGAVAYWLFVSDMHVAAKLGIGGIISFIIGWLLCLAADS